jgi:hypothetical protein
VRHRAAAAADAGVRGGGRAAGARLLAARGRERRFPRVLLGAALVLAAAGPARAQHSPFLSEALFRDLANELSGDRAFDASRALTLYHRTGGSRDFFAAAEWIRQAAVQAGLEDVRLVRQAWSEHGWSLRSAEAWVLEPERVKIADYGDVRVSFADHSHSAHVTAELVDVGAGTGEGDYKGKEVKGRLVLASGSASAVHEEAVWKRGALGVVSYQTNRPEHFDAPDQVAWGRLRHAAKKVDRVKDGTPTTFAVMVSPRRGRALQKMLAAGKAVKVKVDIEADDPEPKEQAYVEGWIRGAAVPDQQIVLTAHIQEEMTSANDDGSGCGSLLEIGRTLSRLIRDGKLARPRRDIRFWWVNEFGSQEQYFRENPQEPRRMLLNVNQDMVGARQSLGGRVQYAARLPWSRPHALEDVMESVLTLVRDANTSLLTARGTPVAIPFPREVVAVKGSREPFHARMVPYFGHSDHHAFTPAPIGVPATALINWPDEFIHSTGDDLDQIDATQIERNALVVAAVAWYFASLREEDAPALAAYVAARGGARLQGDLATGLAHAARAPAEPAGWAAARSLLAHSHARELGALDSVRRLAGAGAAARAVDETRAGFVPLRADAQARLDQAARALGAPAAAAGPSPEEAKLAGRVFVPTRDIGAWQDAMDAVKRVEGLHPIMQFEVFNFADGARTALEVYEAVRAEALSAGQWYYGTVEPADVLLALERGAAAGAFTAKEGR